MTKYPVILNGDHAEFEGKHENTPPKERSDWPLPSFDAKDWAEAFVKLHGGDESLMLTWFACALMRGYDEKGKYNEDASRTCDEKPKPKHERVYYTEVLQALDWMTENGELRDYDDEIANRVEDAKDIIHDAMRRDGYK